MPDDPTPTVLWLEPDQAPFARAVADGAGLRVDRVGCPPAAARGPAEAVAEAFPDAEPFTDLRLALGDREGGLALLLSAGPAERAPGDDAPGPCDDPGFVGAARRRGVALLTTEPSPATCLEAARFGGADALVPVVPLLRDAPAFRAATDALEDFGPVRTVGVSARCGVGAGSLAARLYDAMDLVEALLGLPETVDASVVSRHTTGAPGAPAPGASLRRVRGDLTAHLRHGPNRAAALVLSDRGGAWFRGVTLLGDEGCLRLDEQGFQRFDPEGRLVDESDPRRARRAGRRRAGRRRAGAGDRRPARPRPPSPDRAAPRPDAGAGDVRGGGAQRAHRPGREPRDDPAHGAVVVLRAPRRALRRTRRRRGRSRSPCP